MVATIPIPERQILPQTSSEIVAKLKWATYLNKLPKTVFYVNYVVNGKTEDLTNEYVSLAVS